MWAFLITEIMFFGGLFLAYILYRAKFGESFAAASSHLDWKLGALNTGVLICSSLTMAMAVYHSQTGNRRWLIICLILTMILGAVFLGVTAFEYHDKYLHHLIPGFDFQWTGHGEPQQVQMFYFLDIAMT